MEDKKVIAYIDGYNLYEGCQNVMRNEQGKKSKYGCFKEILATMWYDPRKIVRHCGKFENMDLSDIHVRFYTSKPDKKFGKHNPEHYDRYTAALKEIAVDVVPGKFKSKKKELGSYFKKIILAELESIFITENLRPRLSKKDRRVKHALDNFLDDLKIPISKEKQTDVNLAIDMAEKSDAHTAVLVSGDSDFDPVIKRIIEKKLGMNILVLLPPVPKDEMKDREKRKEKIRTEAQTAAKKAGFPLNEEKFRITNIDIKDIEKCPLSEVKREIDASDNNNKYKHCGCARYENTCKRETP